MVDATDIPPWLQARTDGVVLTVVITPSAKTSAIVGPYGDALKIRVAAPPADGKANAALLKFISAKVGAKNTDVGLLFGATSRRKGILITGVHIDDLAATLSV